jgi:hypothetical protein
VQSRGDLAADLLREHEDPEAVALIIAEAIRSAFDYPGTFAEALAPHAAGVGFRRGDGLAVLTWLLNLAHAPETERWLDGARVTSAALPKRAAR